MCLPLPLLLCALTSLSQTQVVDLAPARDNTLIESATGALSNGLGGGIFCGRTGQPAGQSTRRAALRFDLDPLPQGATIQSVSLHLHLTNLGLEHVCSLHELSADWGEGASDAGSNGGGSGVPAEMGDATWLHTFHAASFWSTPGGDYAATPSAIHTVGAAGEAVWASTPELVADVQGWLDQPTTNFGWLILGDESAGGTSKRFASREALDISTRPVLSVEYLAPLAAPALSWTWILAVVTGIGVAGVLLLRRRGLQPGPV